MASSAGPGDDGRPRTVAELDAAVIECRACPRLVAWREEVARTKRSAFRQWDYWGRPVPGFGDAMARPPAEAALAEPDRWAGSEIVGLGNGGAMLSSSVKSQLAQAFPNAVLNDSYGASETGAAGSEVGASTERDRPRFSTDGRTWVLDPDTLEQDPSVLKRVVASFAGTVALDCWVEAPGRIAVGDPVELVSRVGG